MARKWLYPALGMLIACAAALWWVRGDERGVGPLELPAETASPAATGGGTVAGPDATTAPEARTSTFGETSKGGGPPNIPQPGGGPRRAGEGQGTAVASHPSPQGGKPATDGSEEAVRVTVEVLGPDGVPLYERREVLLGPGEETPLAALRKTGARVETAFGGRYVAAVDGLREKQYGPTSGWCYRVNGEVPLSGAADYRLRQGDVVVWFYVRSALESLGRR